jgi:hypothetical protein
MVIANVSITCIISKFLAKKFFSEPKIPHFGNRPEELHRGEATAQRGGPIGDIYAERALYLGLIEHGISRADDL